MSKTLETLCGWLFIVLAIAGSAAIAFEINGLRVAAFVIGVRFTAIALAVSFKEAKTLLR